MLEGMSVPLTLLGLLDREPSHGYDLKREYDAYFGRGRPLPFGQVYATLARLARDGRAVAGQAEPGAGPDRKRYAITEAGRHDVEAWLAQPIEPEPHLQTELFAKVVLALMLGRSAERYLDAQRSAHLQRMRELTEVKRNGAIVDALLADHGLFHLEADLRWIDLTAARLGRSQRRCSVTRRPPPQPASRGAILEARDAVLSFGETPALQGATLSVVRGEILAVMGPSGSGKSTLLHCLAGILVPDSGEIWFNDRRIDTLRDQERSALRRDRFGFVFQFGQLVPELSAEENVALPLLLEGCAAPRRSARPGRGSSASSSAGWSTTDRGRCRAARHSASRSPAAWWRTPRSSSPTSRRDRWTRSPVSSSWSS